MAKLSANRLERLRRDFVDHQREMRHGFRPLGPLRYLCWNSVGWFWTVNLSQLDSAWPASNQLKVNARGQIRYRNENKAVKTVNAAVLVLTEFGPPQKQGEQPCWANGKKQDCRLANLSWGKPERKRRSSASSVAGGLARAAKTTSKEYAEIGRKGGKAPKRKRATGQGE